MARHPHNTDPHALTRVDVLNARRAGLETMKSIRTVIVILASLVLFAGGFAPAQGQDSARFRFVHADPGSPALDVFVNGELAATDVTYGAATAYMRVPAGEVGLTANLATTSVQLISERLALEAEATAAILASRAGGRIYAAADDLGQLAFGSARVTVIKCAGCGCGSNAGRPQLCAACPSRAFARRRGRARMKLTRASSKCSAVHLKPMPTANILKRL